MNLHKKMLAWTLAGTLAVGSAPVLAGSADEPEFGEMATDLVVARPVGFALTALGTAAFIVSLPFSALGGNVEQAAEKLIIEPGKETFVRCLGCRANGRYDDPDD